MQIPSDDRIQSGAQAADLQRLAYNVGDKLNKQLGKARSLEATIAIASAVEKLSKVWQMQHDTAQSKRTKRAANGHANGHAPRTTARPAPPAPLDEPESKESIIAPDPPGTPATEGGNEATPPLSVQPPES